MLLRTTDPFRDFDRLTQQLLNLGAEGTVRAGGLTRRGVGLGFVVR